MMDQERITWAICSLLLAIATFCLGGFVGAGQGRMNEREAAIKAGVGHWAVNKETGETRFVWGNE